MIWMVFLLGLAHQCSPLLICFIVSMVCGNVCRYVTSDQSQLWGLRAPFLAIELFHFTSFWHGGRRDFPTLRATRNIRSITFTMHCQARLWHGRKRQATEDHPRREADTLPNSSSYVIDVFSSLLTSESNPRTWKVNHGSRLMPKDESLHYIFNNTLWFKSSNKFSLVMLDALRETHSYRTSASCIRFAFVVQFFFNWKASAIAILTSEGGLQFPDKQLISFRRWLRYIIILRPPNVPQTSSGRCSLWGF